MAKGYLAFVLHAHLPFVRHPEYDQFLEERWFYEAMTETYIPLIKVMDRLLEEGVKFGITISISPTLLSMMEDGLLTERYTAHLERLIELSSKEIDRTSYDPHLNHLARMYHTIFSEARDVFVNKYRRRISTAFKKYHENRLIDLITTTSTHAVLPLIASHPKVVEAQIVVGLEYFESVFGFRPSGMWLPECAYSPALDRILEREGIRFVCVESHGIEHASTTPFYSVYAPVFTPSGIAVFGRDSESTRQVWSAREGYPGDPYYREFYRDIGYDLELDYIGPYIVDGIRVDTGIKYYRITGPSSWKELYIPDMARQRAGEHAGDFLFKKVAHVEYLSSTMKTAPVILAPFDAELFGHWWFEGPMWLEFVIRKAVYDQDVVELITLSEYLRRHPVHQVTVPNTSTWGYKGYFDTWLNGKTDWIYPMLYECASRMHRLVERYSHGRVPPLIRRALNQCVRELLLSQASDWPFIIHNGTAEAYAVRRIKDHIARFTYLADSVERNKIDREYLSAIEEMDNIFPRIDYRVFR